MICMQYQPSLTFHPLSVPSGKELDSEEDDVDEEGQAYIKHLAKKVSSSNLIPRLSP